MALFAQARSKPQSPYCGLPPSAAIAAPLVSRVTHARVNQRLFMAAPFVGFPPMLPRVRAGRDVPDGLAMTPRQGLLHQRDLDLAFVVAAMVVDHRQAMAAGVIGCPGERRAGRGGAEETVAVEPEDPRHVGIHG